MSMPGVGIKTASNILWSIGDCQDFADAAHLAAYVGIAPTTRQSGTSVCGEFPTRVGNKQLKKRDVSIGVDRVELPSRIVRLLPA